MRGGWENTSIFDFKFIEHGFIETVFGDFNDELAEREKLSLAEIFFDPNFWCCLGVARGWGEEMTLIDEPGHPKEWMYYTYCARCDEQIIDEENGCPKGCDTDDAYVEAWVMQWHRLIDTIAEGRTAEDFFRELSK